MISSSEKGLESIIVAHLRDVNGYVEGASELYSKEEALAKCGVTDVLRKGFAFNGSTFMIYYPIPDAHDRR